MIKALQLIFSPGTTWDRIAAARRGVIFVFAFYLLPVLLLSSAVVGLGLMHWGKRYGVLQQVMSVTPKVMLQYEAVHLVVGMLMVCLGAQLVKWIAEGFHGQPTYAQCFGAVAYGLGPFLLVRMLDAFPSMNTWVCWGIGIVLTVATLYHGLPRMTRPDPGLALGYYLLSSVSLVLTTGLTHFLGVLVRNGEIVWPQLS